MKFLLTITSFVLLCGQAFATSLVTFQCYVRSDGSTIQGTLDKDSKTMLSVLYRGKDGRGITFRGVEGVHALLVDNATVYALTFEGPSLNFYFPEPLPMEKHVDIQVNTYNTPEGNQILGGVCHFGN